MNLETILEAEKIDLLHVADGAIAAQQGPFWTATHPDGPRARGATAREAVSRVMHAAYGATWESRFQQ
jgi:hypothetical protein